MKDKSIKHAVKLWLKGKKNKTPRRARQLVKLSPKGTCLH